MPASFTISRASFFGKTLNFEEITFDFQFSTAFEQRYFLGISFGYYVQQYRDIQFRLILEISLHSNIINETGAFSTALQTYFMGNTSQCGFLSHVDQQFQYLGEENHFLYGQIKHFKSQKVQCQHFAIKKLKFPNENKLKEFQEFIQFYQSFCSAIRLIKANEYADPNSKQKSQKMQGIQTKNDQKQNANPLFYCNKENFIFSSPSQDLSCSEPSFPLTLNLEYLEQKLSLQTILDKKALNVLKATESKINQNILLELQNKVKLCQYNKIDKLPQKERSIINLFFNEIQVLRMLDCMLTALYGLKLNGIDVDAIRPELFFKTIPQNDEISYFHPEVMNCKYMTNFQKSYETLKRWLNEQNAKFHHNWTLKQKQLISYLHPDSLQKLTQLILTEGQENFISMSKKSSRRDYEKQNIFALGLMILEICLLEPHICSKVYNVSICRKEEKNLAMTKKEMKYSFHRQNLTIKLNNSALQKYLIQMKTRYSEGFEELVETMIFGCSLNETSKQGKSALKDHNLTYEDVIQRLEVLIEQNIENLKSVYSSTNKSKSKSIQCTQKNSRNSSLSRQISSSGVSNQSLSSSSSLSMLPVQSQQKVLSFELLKKHCKKLQNKLDKILVKSELQTLKGSFVEREGKLEELISKDEERILTQLNKLNNEKSLPQKQSRFSYRRAQNSQQINPRSLEAAFPTSIYLTMPKEEYGNYKLTVPASLSTKSQAQSQDKQKRINSTTKTKKIYIQKAREEESLGNSVCQTIYLKNSKDRSNTDEPQMSNGQNETISKDMNGNRSKVQLKNTQITEKEVSAFEEDPMQQFSSKSELKNLIVLKNKVSTTSQPKQHSNTCINAEQKNLKQLKSKELYEMYMKEYNNLVSSQKIVIS